MLSTAKNKRNSLLFVASLTLLAPITAIAGGAEPAASVQAAACYDVIKPELEFSEETIKEIHGNLLKNNVRFYQVELRTKLDSDGKATSIEFLKKDSIDELNDVAQTIVEVAPVKCADAGISEVTQKFMFALSYVPGAKRGTLKGMPVFTRKIANDVQPGQAKRYCKVSKRDDNGKATDVSCEHDAVCVVTNIRDAIPAYPRDELNGGRSGMVNVEVDINREGNVIGNSVIISSGNKNLDNAAIAAAKKQKFSCSGNNPLLTYDAPYTFEAGN